MTRNTQSEHLFLGLHTASLGNVTLAGQHNSAHATHVLASGTRAGGEVTVLVDTFPRVSSLSLFFSECEELLLVEFVGLSAAVNLTFALTLEFGELLLGSDLTSLLVSSLGVLLVKELTLALLVGFFSSSHQFLLLFSVIVVSLHLGGGAESAHHLGSGVGEGV